MTEVRDLGVKLDYQLLFSPHVDVIVAKAYKMLGFIFRQGKDFKNYNTLILLYNSLVRSLLEYSSIVWNPQYSIHSDAIERIQDKFVRRMKFKYHDFCKYNMVSLRDRREHRDQMFLFKIINSMIESPYLLSSIIFKCPRANARHKKLFAPPFCKTNYAKNRFIVRACNKYNESYSNVDIFSVKYNAFVKAIRNEK